MNYKDAVTYQAAIDRLIDAYCHELHLFAGYDRAEIKRLYIEKIEDGKALTKEQVEWILTLQKSSIWKQVA